MLLIFNDIAGSEILLILVFVLIFFGSKSIPGFAITLSKTIRQVKEASDDIQNEIKKSGREIKSDLNLDGLIRDTAEEIKRPLDQYAKDIEDVVKRQPQDSISRTANQAQKIVQPKKTEVLKDAEKPSKEES